MDNLPKNTVESPARHDSDLEQRCRKLPSERQLKLQVVILLSLF